MTEVRDISQSSLLKLSQLIGHKPDEVMIARDLINQGTAYHSWEIPKGTGGKRKITAPAEELSKLQQSILRRVLYGIPVHLIAHGFLRNRDIFSNAAQHFRAKFMLNLDLKDAFPSVREHRVSVNLEKPLNSFLRKQYGKRISAKEMEDIRWMIVKLCCFDGCLPQGAATSPALLNIVCMNLDQELFAIASDNQLVVSRYADDITFSSENSPISGDVKQRIFSTVSNTGWKVNPLKTRYFSRRLGHSLEVTGLLIQADGKLTITPERRDTYKKFLAQLLEKAEISEEEKHKAIGIIVYLSRVYNGRLPSTFGKVWGRIKTKFAIKDAPKSPEDRYQVNAYSPQDI